MCNQVRLGVEVLGGLSFAARCGAGRNGAEYSVLIIASLVAAALTDSAGWRPGRP